MASKARAFHTAQACDANPARPSQAAPRRRDAVVDSAQARAVAMAAAVIWLGACGGQEPAAPPPAADAARVEVARAALAGLQADLRAALSTAISAGGPASAIDVCATEAPRLAAAAATPTLQIGRATRRPRNPANAAAGWQAAAIAYLEALPASERGAATFARSLPGGALGYATPLLASGVCLLCHGTAVAPDVAAAIAARYPADTATGYSDGELRGVAWAEVASP